MAKRPGQAELPPLQVGQTSTKFIAPDAAFWSVHNLTPTDEGGYISVRGPLPVVPADSGGNPNSSATTATSVPLTYGPTYGVFHARLQQGERDVLLLHTQNQIWEFNGWDRRWNVLVGPAATLPIYEDTIPDPAISDYRTQFVATPTGVVIVPSFGRAYFYDGIRVLPLGYSRTPGPPSGLGPENSGGQFFPTDAQPLFGVNDAGYIVDGLWGGQYSSPTSLEPYFRYGRIGTATTPGNVQTLTENDKSQTMAYLEPGRWRAKVQWIDTWGNLSPLSPASNDVRVSRQPSEYLTPTGVTNPYTLNWCNADMVRKQIAWDGISTGPDGTIGRNLFRTKDMVNSGSTEFYEVPRDASSNVQAFATIPDNASRFFPDNIPDTWLVNEAVDVVPVPMFRLAAMCFGRLFIGNVRGDPGVLMWSMPGRWGTFERAAKLYPDPTASAITGMHRVDGGLLVFTESGVYLVTPNADGTGFRSATVSSTIGCIAPQSIVTMRNGVTIWLGRDGFYGFSGGEPTFLFDQHRFHAKRFNKAVVHRSIAVFEHKTGQYRCWVPYESALSANLCFCYDGTSWHTRDDTTATGATVTADHRKLVIVSGTNTVDSGVWVVDRGGDVLTAELITGWLRNLRSKDRSSIRFVWLWLRETGTYTLTAAPATPGSPVTTVAGQIRVDVYRDYRSEIESTTYTQAYAVEGGDGPAEPSFWDQASYGTEANWRHRRPYWARVSIDVPTCETFKIKLSCDNEIEILAISFDEMPRDAAGATAYGV